MTELMNYSSNAPAQVMSLEEKINYAETLARSSLLPKSYSNQPANILLAMEMGEAMDIPAIQAINEVHVIEGRPSASADLIGGMVRRAGHILRVQGDTKSATAQVIRKDDPDFTFEVTWDLEKAKSAGLYPGKPTSNWSKYPAAMLKARAITEVARSACPESLYGVSHTPEELGSVIDADGNPVQPARNVPVSPNMEAGKGGSAISQARQRTQQRSQAHPQPDRVSNSQAQEILNTLASVGITEAARQPQAIADIIGRQIGQPSEITQDEYATIMAALTEGTVEDAEIVDDAETNGSESDQAHEALETFVNG